MGGNSAVAGPQLADFGGLALPGLSPAVREAAMDPRGRGQGVLGVLQGGLRRSGDLRPNGVGGVSEDERAGGTLQPRDQEGGAKVRCNVPGHFVV